MNKAELEKKNLSDLHRLAAEAGVEKYRMLSKGELVEKLATGNGSAAAEEAPERGGSSEQRSERPRRRRRSRSTGSPAVADAEDEEKGARGPRDRSAGAERDSAPKPAAEPEPVEPDSPPEPAAAASTRAAAEPQRPRRRRRRRFGRRGKQAVTLQGLLLPPEAGRQALVFAETREGCTALLRGVAADLAADTKGPDPVALLIDPSPEELADWKRDAPQAEIVSAGQPRHASDALAQAASRAAAGDDVILLVDSLTRLGEAYDDAEAAKEFFDAGRVQGSAGGGSLTVVAALERSSD
ncbi:MAG TPA: Rho termination factor N-terminal domain-containing protein [Solirubrobacterales bacterium]|nr:Rho termination factor N-terminal domain-containing protein [Solirubrobacterales bacterium]